MGASIRKRPVKYRIFLRVFFEIFYLFQIEVNSSSYCYCYLIISSPGTRICSDGCDKSSGKLSRRISIQYTGLAVVAVLHFKWEGNCVSYCIIRVCCFVVCSLAISLFLFCSTLSNV